MSFKKTLRLDAINSPNSNLFYMNAFNLKPFLGVECSEKGKGNIVMLNQAFFIALTDPIILNNCSQSGNLNFS